MSSPSGSLSTLRPDLGGSLLEYDLEGALAGFVATRALPVFETMKQSGPFGKFTIEALLQGNEDRRAPGGSYARLDNQFGTDTFATKEHGIESVVDAREAEMYADYFDAEFHAALRARFAVLQNLEVRVAAALFNSTTWTGALTTAIDPAKEWDAPAAGLPVTDVHAARAKVYSQCGMWPNAVIMSRTNFDAATQTAEVIDRLKYAGHADPAVRVAEGALASLFDVDQVIVADSAKNTAIEGQTASISGVWSDEYVMVAKVATGNDIREPCVGRILHWGADGSSMGGAVETYGDNSVRGDVVRVRMDVDEKILYPEAGHLISNAHT